MKKNIRNIRITREEYGEDRERTSVLRSTHESSFLANELSFVFTKYEREHLRRIVTYDRMN